jgi:hypothetical protein
MWPLPVVVGAVPGEDDLQVPLTKGQDAVGQLGPDGLDESFGEAVRPRTSRRNLHGVDPRAGQDGVEAGVELAGPVVDEETEAGSPIVEVHQQVAACRVVHTPVGWLERGYPRSVLPRGVQGKGARPMAGPPWRDEPVVTLDVCQSVASHLYLDRSSTSRCSLVHLPLRCLVRAP